MEEVFTAVGTPASVGMGIPSVARTGVAFAVAGTPASVAEDFTEAASSAEEGATQIAGE